MGGAHILHMGDCKKKKPTYAKHWICSPPSLAHFPNPLKQCGNKLLKNVNNMITKPCCTGDKKSDGVFNVGQARADAIGKF